MPAVTMKQQRFMALCSTPAGRKKARGRCPPLAIAKEFSKLKKKRKGKR